MKRTLLATLAVVALALSAFGQQTGVTAPIPNLSYSNGVYYAPNFGLWSIPLTSTITGGSSTSFTVAQGFARTPDGINFVPFVANGKILIGTGSLAEIATVSSVSGCTIAAIAGSQGYNTVIPTCTVTLSGTTTNSHYPSEPIGSADAGIMEAISLAQNAVGGQYNGQLSNSSTSAGGGTGGGVVYFSVDCGGTTLSTGALTTTTTCFVPNQFYNQGSASRVTTTITTSANWAVGIVNNTSAFSTANSTLTAGTTAYNVQGTPAVALVTGATAPNLTAVLYTMGTSNPGAGAIKSKVWGYVSVQPSF